ncbi:monocarboxylate transporter 12-like isoform X1 [Styela clava]
MTDSGSRWRWVVLIACFVSAICISIFYYAFGTFVLYWIDEFSATTASVAAVSSAGPAIASIASPFGCFCVEKLGYRWTHVIGGIMMMTAFATSSFAQTLSQLFFTYSILGGLGFCFCLTSYINAVIEHFLDEKALAFGLISSAFGIASFVFPLYFEALIEPYSWRGVMLITSGFFGNMIVSGLLFYPVDASPPLPSFSCRKQKQIDTRTSPSSLILEGSNIYKDGLQTSITSILLANESRSTSIDATRRKHTDDILNNDQSQAIKNNKNDCSDLTHVDKKLSYFQVTKILASSWSFYLVVIHNTVLYMGIFIVLSLTTARASYDLNLTEEQAAQIVSTFGINAIFRILYGLLSRWKVVKTYNVYFSCFSLAGVLTLLSVFAKSFTMQIVYGLCWGAMLAGLTHYPVVVYEIFGSEFFNIAFGYLEVMHGIGVITGTIIGGILFDVTGSSVSTFIFAGLSLLVGSFIMPIGLWLTGQIKLLDF